MLALRIIIIAACIALGTVILGWWMVPILAFVYGIVARGTKRPGSTAALAAALAWGGYLAITALSGAPVGLLGTRLALSMQLPVWGPIVATLVFPALLAGLASYLGARVGAHYLTTP
jgi:hypothetical protein